MQGATRCTPTPNKLDAGWIYRIFQYCDFVRIFVRPVNPSLYVSMLRGSIKTAHLSAKKDTIDGSAMIEVMKDKVLSQNQSQIVSVRVVFGVLGSTRGCSRRGQRDSAQRQRR